MKRADRSCSNEAGNGEVGLCDVKNEFGDAWRVIAATWDASHGGWERLAELEGTRANRPGRDPFLKRRAATGSWINDGRLGIDLMAAHPWPPI